MDIIYYFQNIFANELNFNHLNNIPVRCTFVLCNKQLSTNIMVLRTLDLHYYYLSANSLVSAYSGTNIKRQSRIRFVEMHLKHVTIGAEHRNI
jgi:hypothetical protein